MAVAPGRGECMGDGWETARQPLRPASYERQEDGLMLLPGQDWAVIKCGTYYPKCAHYIPPTALTMTII